MLLELKERCVWAFGLVGFEFEYWFLVPEGRVWQFSLRRWHGGQVRRRMLVAGHVGRWEMLSRVLDDLDGVLCALQNDPCDEWEGV